MNAFYEQMHTHTKIAKFSIFRVHCTTFFCPLSLLVLAAMNPRAGACRVLPKGGPVGLGFAPIRGVVMYLGRWEGCWSGPGVGSGIHLHGCGLRGSFGLGPRGLLSPGLGFKLSRLGGQVSQRVSVWFGVRLLFGLGGLLTWSCSLLLLLMGHCCSMRGMQQIPLHPKHLLFPWVFHPHSPPPPPPTTKVTTPGETPSM